MSSQPDSLALDAAAGTVEAARTGDRAALATIYRQYVERVFRYALVRVGDRAAAEDVTATVFVRVLEAIERYQPSGAPFGAWLFRIAHNVVIDHVRRGQRALAAPLSAAGQAGIDPADSSDMLDVRAALERLTDLQRQVLEYRFAAGLSGAEIAVLLDRKENAVKQLQHAAIVRLRQILAEERHAPPA